MPKTLEQKYKQLTDIEHVLQAPGMYIGSIDPVTQEMWIMEDKTIIKREITFTPGLYKIFDEILVNALDHYTRTKSVSKIQVSIDANEISVYNDGDGIEIEIHKEVNKYIPEMIFMNMKTSGNYDKTEDKITGGKHGYGAKLTAIFSKVFTVETVDSERQKKYIQTARDNLSIIEQPKISSCKNKSYTKITFQPDFIKFGITEITEDHINLFKKRIYDICACTPNDVSVWLNGEKLPVKNFQKYCELYFEEPEKVIYESPNERWEIAVVPSDTNYEQVSFVNGICTYKGGKHVDYVTDQIVSGLVENMKKKKKDITIKPSYVKQNIFVFVKSVIVNPDFPSQTKEELTTPIKKFGSSCIISDSFIQKLMKTSIVESVMNTVEMMENKELKKTDGKKKTRITGIPKLDDANKAGTSDSYKCTLILTEGDSAKALAVAGISAIQHGRDYFGVFPLRGKLINVRDASNTQIKDNVEINAIKQIVGLQAGKVYKDTKELRYGHILLMTDQDTDGFHIKGLNINMIDSGWKSLLDIPDFIQDFRTPIVKATKGKEEKVFYSLTEYANFKETANGNWKIKYYKGLGTSTSQEGKEYFKKLQDVIRNFVKDSTTDDKLSLAFSKERADERKEWLKNYDQNDIIDTKQQQITYTEFIDKELKHFSNYDNIRSIPRINDGLKPSTRKITYATKIRSWNGEIKVAQFAGFIAEKTAYHHGEQSLMGAIIGMAVDYVGSNNINTLKPNGQFGTRIAGGKDAASPRYIFTEPSDEFSKIYHPDDDKLLNYLDDDGTLIEPECYYPVIPMVLVNGAIGIGTGWSTNIPCYSPEDIKENIKRLLNEEEPLEMIPWYRGFKGTVEKVNNKIKINGIYTVKGDTLTITELPVGVWTDTYKEFLEKQIEDKVINSYDDYKTDVDVHFVIKFVKGKLEELICKDDFKKKWKLETTISLENFVLFNTSGKIHRYANEIEILKEYYEIRLQKYKERKEYLLSKYKLDLEIASSKARFIKEIIDEKIVVFKKTKQQIEDQLMKGGYLKRDNNYDYLINMPISSFTKERIKKLEEERDCLEKKWNELNKITEKELWLNDLEQIE